jgi:hypothetical protein
MRRSVNVTRPFNVRANIQVNAKAKDKVNANRRSIAVDGPRHARDVDVPVVDRPADMDAWPRCVRSSFGNWDVRMSGGPDEFSGEPARGKRDAESGSET